MQWQQVIGWGVAAGVAVGVLFGIAPYNYVGAPEMSTTEAVLYGGAHRAAWGAAVAWVVVACTWGYGGESEPHSTRIMMMMMMMMMIIIITKTIITTTTTKQ